MPASGEPLPPGSFLIRGGPEHHSWEQGDPYDMTLVLTPPWEGNPAQIIGMSGVPTPSIWRELREIMRKEKIEYAEYQRMVGGVPGPAKIIRV